MIYMYHFWYYPYTNSGIHTKNGTNKPIGLLQDTHFVCTKYHLVKGETPKTPFQQTTASARPYVNDAHRNLTISPQSRIQVLHLCRILILKKIPPDLPSKFHYLSLFSLCYFKENV